MFLRQHAAMAVMMALQEGGDDGDPDSIIQFTINIKIKPVVEE